VEPIPETVRVIADFGPFVIEHEDLLAELLDKAQQVQAVVPQCVGISVASNEDDVTFTLVATAPEIAVLDAIQYVAGGPCVEAAKTDEVLAYDQAGLFDEEEWQLFAQATAAAAVASTLSLPIVQDAHVIGGVNLYASTTTAFDGHHEAIAAIFDAWAPGAVTNADLSFTTRNIAEAAPDLLREDIDLSVAVGLIANQDRISIDHARQRLSEAARRAGVSQAQLAQTIIELRRLQDSD
jgi:GAF domain-containing protein